jgi:hypothetical protein
LPFPGALLDPPFPFERGPIVLEGVAAVKSRLLKARRMVRVKRKTFGENMIE